MKPRVSLITLRVEDLKRPLRFYRDGLGLETRGVIGVEFEHGAVVLFDLEAGLKLALYPRAYLVKDTGLILQKRDAPTCSLGHNVALKAKVNAGMQQAKNVGTVIVKPAQAACWTKPPRGGKKSAFV